MKSSRVEGFQDLHHLGHPAQAFGIHVTRGPSRIQKGHMSWRAQVINVEEDLDKAASWLQVISMISTFQLQMQPFVALVEWPIRLIFLETNPSRVPQREYAWNFWASEGHLIRNSQTLGVLFCLFHPGGVINFYARSFQLWWFSYLVPLIDWIQRSQSDGAEPSCKTCLYRHPQSDCNLSLAKLCSE